jgi:hypothetical protein
LYDETVSGTDTLTNTPISVNPTYYASGSATASLAAILGLTATSTPSVVGASGGPFMDPAQSGLIVPSGGAPTPQGSVANTGQLISELQNTNPGLWQSVLNSYGLPDSSSINTQLSQFLGAGVEGD